jgi:Tol biopolymer transport system component
MHLWTGPLDTGPLQLLSQNSAFGRLSRDGARVGYVRIRPETTDPATGLSEGIIAVKAPGGTEQPLTAWTRGHYMPWDWSPDDQMILAAKDSDLALWSVNTTAAVTPAAVALRISDRVGQARYSPDGNWLALSATVDRTGESRIFVTSSTGDVNRPVKAVAPDHLHADLPRWSRDGRRILFLSTATDGSTHLWAADFDSNSGMPVGEPYQISQFDSPTFRISPSMNFSAMEVRGEFVYVAMRSVSGNLWALDSAGSGRGTRE